MSSPVTGLLYWWAVHSRSRHWACLQAYELALQLDDPVPPCREKSRQRNPYQPVYLHLCIFVPICKHSIILMDFAYRCEHRFGAPSFLLEGFRGSSGVDPPSPGPRCRSGSLEEIRLAWYKCMDSKVSGSNKCPKSKFLSSDLIYSPSMFTASEYVPICGGE